MVNSDTDYDIRCVKAILEDLENIYLQIYIYN